MRAVVIKDPHLRFGRSRPVGRKASFFGEVRAKLKFIKEYCDENEIGNIILTGDILDQKDPAKYSFNCYRENKEVLIDLISKDSKYTLRRILSVYGNHDIVDGRYKESVYAELVNDVVIEDLSDDFVGFKGVVLCGVGHQYEKDEFFKRLKALGDGLGEAGFIVDRRKIVCVVHQAVLPQEAESVAEGFLDALNYQQLAKGYPFVDVWVIGHYHKGYPVQEVGGKYFINPYSLVRLSRGEHVREHTPQLVDCDFVNNIYKTVGIPHLPYDEVFEEERVEVQSSGFDGDIIENIKKLREDKGLAEGLIEDDDIRSLIEHYLTEADKLLK